MEHFLQFVINHWYLWSAFVAVLILVIINEQATQKKGPKRISANEAVNWINHHQAQVFDIRDATVFKKNHIINSKNKTVEQLMQINVEKDKDLPIIIVCQRGVSAMSTAVRLQKKGFSKPMVLDGGFTAWVSSGLPTKKG